MNSQMLSHLTGDGIKLVSLDDGISHAEGIFLFVYSSRQQLPGLLLVWYVMGLGIYLVQIHIKTSFNFSVSRSKVVFKYCGNGYIYFSTKKNQKKLTILGASKFFSEVQLQDISKRFHFHVALHLAKTFSLR